MPRRIKTGRSPGITVAWLTWWFAALAPASAGNDAELLKLARQTFGTLAEPAPEDLARPLAELGRALFWDPRLSADGKTSCASCHLAAEWGSDRRPFSPDARGKLTKRHSQTVFNAMLQPKLRWTGDRESGADQALRSITGSMGFSEASGIVPLLRESDHAGAFAKAFPGETDPVTPANYAKALEAYQTTLVTPAPLDRFLGGDGSALDERQKRGLALFLKVGCADCHDGDLLGGRSFSRFGIERPYWEATGSEGRDGGIFETSKNEKDRDRFRVAMLRNIVKTAPYFHDGAVADLGTAIRVMAEVQLGETLRDDEIGDLIAFLGSLSGKVPDHFAPPAKVP